VKHEVRGTSRGGQHGWQGPVRARGGTGEEGSGEGDQHGPGEGTSEEGPGGGSSTGALCIEFTLVHSYFNNMY